jgi:hypothetical protein
MMTRDEFIALIGQDVVVDYPFGQEIQQWSMKNFAYDPKVEKLAEMKKEILDYYKKQLFRASRNLERARTEAERKSLKIKVNAYRWALSMAADKWKEDENDG